MNNVSIMPYQSILLTNTGQCTTVYCSFKKQLPKLVQGIKTFETIKCLSEAVSCSEAVLCSEVDLCSEAVSCFHQCLEPLMKNLNLFWKQLNLPDRGLGMHAWMTKPLEVFWVDCWGPLHLSSKKTKEQYYRPGY